MVQTKIKTSVISSKTFFSEIVPLFKIMWKNIVQPDRPQMTIWRSGIACWIPKATNTHSEYVIHFDFPRQKMVARTRVNVTLCL